MTFELWFRLCFFDSLFRPSFVPIIFNLNAYTSMRLISIALLSGAAVDCFAWRDSLM